MPRIILAAATLGGVGYLPLMPGTWGTLAALPLWFLLAHLGPWGYGLAFTLFLALALAVAGPAQRLLGKTDHGAIVIDEAAGLLVALAGAPLTWTWAVGGFVAFRVLDILKPWPIRALSRGEGSLEVVVDDVFAGLMARVGLELLLGSTG
uniref:Phosphatidylglycerophosphatase A n=1 Tax=Desulfobacca acetoxidans TaxID=60893 RepID=A0A7V4GA55_9BACT